MDVDFSNAPSMVQELVDLLELNGFRLSLARGSGAVNRLIEMRRGELGVRVTVDRGQWWIELGGGSVGDWYDPDVWAACLVDTPIRIDPSSVDEQVGFVIQRWREVVEALGTEGIEECLARNRSIRARTRLGLPPAGDNRGE